MGWVGAGFQPRKSFFSNGDRGWPRLVAGCEQTPLPQSEMIGYIFKASFSTG